MLAHHDEGKSAVGVLAKSLNAVFRTTAVAALGTVLLAVAGCAAEADDPGLVASTAALATTTPPAVVDAFGDFVEGPCPIEIPSGYEITCGALAVPEDRTDPASAVISLAVAIVHPVDAAALPPVVYLTGGPGGSALDDFDVDPAGWDYPFLIERDLVLLDQRGTGYSEPTLDCPELTDDDTPESDLACHDRLVEWGIDINAYNTRENASDVEALRLALGIEEWDLLGVSYGTRLALDVMRFYPDGLGAVVLDSPFPPNADTPVDEVYGMTDALAELFTDCAADEYCSSQYPDLETVFLDTVNRLNFDESAEIFGDDLVTAMRTAFTDGTLISAIPRVIYEVANGNYDALDEIAGDGAGFGRRQGAADRSDSEGMYYSVMCHDEYALGDYERVEAAIVGTIPVELEGVLLQDTFYVSETCNFWNPMTTVDNTAVVSDVPTLILVGQYDPATPPRWAYTAAETLSNSYVLLFPGAGHSLLSSGECAIDITSAFLADPLSPPDTTCIDDIDWPYFE